MLENYIYCPATSSEIFFDARFAAQYGVNEAIIFNNLYYAYSESLTMTKHRSKIWHDESGWLREGGYWWERCTQKYLFERFSIFLCEQEHKTAIKNLCDAGLLYVRPSMTEGYYWIRFCEGSEDRD